tara:strand:+ start:12531 stop:13217 length:687 start_codon:yes stop_codon:yes gene_type:complete
MERWSNFSWSSVELVVFDVDGTLFDLKRIRFKMACRLIYYYFLHPLEFKDFYRLLKFRKLREKAILEPPAIAREIIHSIAFEVGVSPSYMDSLVKRWMIDVPCKLLRGARFHDLVRFFKLLEARGIKLAVWSDYPTEQKLDALGLQVEFQMYPEISKSGNLKPSPSPLAELISQASVSAGHVLVIGDREECDGAAARALGANFILLTKMPQAVPHFVSYTELCAQLNE